MWVQVLRAIHASDVISARLLDGLGLQTAISREKGNITQAAGWREIGGRRLVLMYVKRGCRKGLASGAVMK